MVLFFSIIIASIIGIIYGKVNRNKAVLAISAIVLIFIVAIMIVYSYLYAQNPY